MTHAHGAAVAVASLVAIAQDSEPVVCSSCPFAGCPDCAYQVACDGCGTHTTTPAICDHFALCPSCIEDGCRPCDQTARYEARLAL